MPGDHIQEGVPAPETQPQIKIGDEVAGLQRELGAARTSPPQIKIGDEVAGLQRELGAARTSPQPQHSALDIEAIAIICHETNRAFCEVTGDRSQRPWPLAAEWQQESAVNGVKFALENPDAPESAQHDAWMADKLADGWTYGPVKDAEARTHPCLVPFDQLPPLQQAKDRLFRAVVKALTPNLD
jgi:hypothetical protein